MLNMLYNTFTIGDVTIRRYEGADHVSINVEAVLNCVKEADETVYAFEKALETFLKEYNSKMK